MSKVASRAQTVFEPGLRYGQKSMLRTPKSTMMLSNRKVASRGLLRGSSSLWWVGRKYHKLDQPGEVSDDSNASSDNNSPARSAVNTAAVVTPPKVKTGRRIHWNERVRVRRFERIDPEFIGDCYYTEEELYSFHREYVMEDDELDFLDDDDQGV